MVVELSFTEDPAAFLARAAGVLAADPVLASVVSTYTRRLAAGHGPVPSPDVPRWWVLVHEDGDPVSAAMRTMPDPPHAAFVLAMSQDAALALARALHERGERLSGVNGALPAAEVVAEETARLTGGSATVHGHHRLHLLGSLVAPRPVPGRLRPVRVDEVDLAAAWCASFAADAARQAGREPEDDAAELPRDAVERRVLDGVLWFWEDETGPVHLTGANLPADGVARIGPVFTPAGLRGRGYASAAVHGVSRLLLEQGSQVCLFTDQANPTSNKVYADLGFEPYVDTALYWIVSREVGASVPAGP